MRYFQTTHSAFHLRIVHYFSTDNTYAVPFQQILKLRADFCPERRVDNRVTFKFIPVYPNIVHNLYGNAVYHLKCQEWNENCAIALYRSFLRNANTIDVCQPNIL